MSRNRVVYHVVQSENELKFEKSLTDAEVLREYSMFATPLRLHFMAGPPIEVSCAPCALAGDGVLVTLESPIPVQEMDLALAQMIVEYNYSIPGLGLVIKSKRIVTAE